MIIFNDVLLIIGSALKEQIEGRYLVVDQWDTCSLFLGIGNLLVWFGVLRYLGFFKTYNVVILTLKKAAPKILRFLIAALLIYAGFVFCGWLILGPYHMKFRSLATTSECLFALINGDDMFATFATLSSKATWLWWVDGREEQPEFPGSSAASYQEERMRRKLQFFFMNPIEKWQAKRKFPYKFVVQVSSHPGFICSSHLDEC